MALYEVRDGKVVNTYELNPISSHCVVNAIALDHNRRLWLATTHELVCRDNGQWLVYDTSNTNLSTNYIYSIDFDSQNRVWCGTFGGGLQCFDGSRFTSYTTGQNLPSNYVAAVCVDKNDAVWFNCRNSLYPEIYGLGVSALRGGQVATYTTDNSGLASNTMWDIKADGQNNVWLATGDDQGVTQFDGTHWQIYNVKNSGLALNEATCITLDEANRRIWFTAYSGGGVSLAQLPDDPAAISTVSAADGMVAGNRHLAFALPTDVSIYNLSDSLVLKAHNTDIPLNGLASGVYIL